MEKGIGEQRLVALFAGGCLLSNYPLLALWDQDAALLGVPLFPAALFLIWAALIVALAWIVEGCEDGDPPTSPLSTPEVPRARPSRD